MLMSRDACSGEQRGASMKPILESIRELLSQAGIDYREVHHEPTRTSEESAQARGEDLRTGGKALLMRGNEEYLVFVLPANRRADSAAIRRELQIRRLRFATREELFELTGLLPGSLPPFGRPILPFTLYVDAAIRDNVRIAFNAGSLTDSMIMSVGDYLRVAGPERIFPFGVEAG